MTVLIDNVGTCTDLVQGDTVLIMMLNIIDRHQMQAGYEAATMQTSGRSAQLSISRARIVEIYCSTLFWSVPNISII